MAGLVGAKYDFTLPNTNIGVSYSAEKIFHINGIPRENYIPQILIDLQKDENRPGDAILTAGINNVMKKINK